MVLFLNVDVSDLMFYFLPRTLVKRLLIERGTWTKQLKMDRLCSSKQQVMSDSMLSLKVHIQYSQSIFFFKITLYSTLHLLIIVYNLMMYRR